MTQLADQAQRHEALNTQKSFIVQAPAGSGKTELLTQRFLALLNTVKKPDNILAITFTRKAAQEMRARILKKLETTHDIKLAETILNNPHSLKIQTIDSFCGELSNSLPIMSDTGAISHITEDADSLYETAINQFFDEADNASYVTALQNILLTLDNQLQNLSVLFLYLLKTREQWLPYLLEDKHHLKTKVENALHIVNQNALENLFATIPAEIFRPLASELHLDENATLEEKKYFAQALLELLLTKTGTWRKRAEPHILNHINVLSKITGLEKQLFAVKCLPELTYSENQWQSLEALHELLPLLCAKLKLVFYQQNTVDFTEVALSAISALGALEAPSDLALKLDYQIQHILIDEFQDTSSLQWRLLQLLTQGWQEQDGKTLFLVGDPMQSIYRFRQAEVGIFLRAKDYGVNDIKLHYLVLSSNFRSQKKLIHWFNQTFKMILPANSNYNLGAVHYSEKTAIKAETHHAINAYEFDFRDTEAAFIVSQIKGLLAETQTDTIAILVRTRNQLEPFFKHLKQEKIEFYARDIEKLAEKPWILDILSLVRAITNPYDRVAWLSILRAPWCGLDLNSLYTLTNNDTSQTIYSCLQDDNIIKQLKPDMQHRLSNLSNIIEQALSFYQQLNFSTLIHDCWLKLNAPACYTFDINDDIEVFLSLLDRFENQPEFLDLELLETTLEKTYAKNTQACRLELMTIHKSKGLEFDHVFMPGLEKGQREQNNPLLYISDIVIDNRNHLLIASKEYKNRDSAYTYLHNLEKQKNELESRRLLYVAVTRAKQSLTLSMTKPDKNSSNSFAHVLKNHIEFQPMTIDTKSHAIQQKLFYRLPMTSMVNNKISLLSGEAYALNQNHEDEKIVGTLVHKALEFIAATGLTQWHQAKTKQYAHYLNAQLGNRANHLTPKIIAIIEKTLSDEKARWILSEHPFHQAEFEIAEKTASGIQKQIIDRLFIDKNETLWIIDYKLTEEINIEDYRAQITRYAKLCKNLFKKTPRCGIYSPLNQSWEELTIEILA